MQTVVLAGGVGKRTYPLCHDEPKSLYRIMGKPILSYVIDGLEFAHLRDFIFVIPERDDRIAEYLSKRDDLNILYAYQREALGMGNAIQSTRDLLKEEFLVVNADDIYEPRLLVKILDEHRRNPTGLTLAIKATETPWKYGIVEIYQGRPERIVEKPKKGEEPSNLAVVGVYLFSLDILDFLAQVSTSDHQLEDAYQKYMDRGDAEVIEYDGYFGSFKYPRDLLDISRYLMQVHIKGQEIHTSAESKDKRTVIDGDVKIEDGTMLSGTVIRGPCYIGKNTSIRNALISEACIGDNCLVEDSEIARSFVGDNSEFRQVFIEDSVVGDRCQFVDGTIAAKQERKK